MLRCRLRLTAARCNDRKRPCLLCGNTQAPSLTPRMLTPFLVYGLRKVHLGFKHSSLDVPNKRGMCVMRLVLRRQMMALRCIAWVRSLQSQST